MINAMNNASNFGATFGKLNQEIGKTT